MDLESGILHLGLFWHTVKFDVSLQKPVPAASPSVFIGLGKSVTRLL